MLTAIILSGLITWVIMGILFFVIDDTGSEIAKYIIALPIIVIIYLPLKAASKISNAYIRHNYDSYDISGHNACVKQQFAEQIGLPKELKMLSGKDFKSIPFRSNLVKSYEDFQKHGFSKEYIEKLKEKHNGIDTQK